MPEGWGTQIFGGFAGVEFGFQTDQCCDGIGGSGAQAALDREALVYMDVTSAGTPRASSASATIFQAVLRSSVGTRWSLDVRRIGGSAGRLRRNGDQVVEFNGLVDGRQGVKAVRAGGPYIEAEVDLGVRAHGGGHTGPL